MKGNSKVLSALQEAINLEASLAAAYCLNGQALKHTIGIKVAGELKSLGKQSKCYKKMLVKQLLFLEGTPEVAPDTAVVEDSISAMLDDLLKMENDTLARYTEFTKICYDADDMPNFHLFQHLCKFHSTGGNGNEGHLDYLSHEIRQLAKPCSPPHRHGGSSEL